MGIGLFVEKLPYLRAYRLRRVDGEGLPVQHLGAGYVAVTYRPWQEAGTDPGVDEEMARFPDGKESHVETAYIFFTKITKNVRQAVKEEVEIFLRHLGK